MYFKVHFLQINDVTDIGCHCCCWSWHLLLLLLLLPTTIAAAVLLLLPTYSAAVVVDDCHCCCLSCWLPLLLLLFQVQGMKKVGTSNIDMNSLQFDLSLFKSLQTLEVVFMLYKGWVVLATGTYYELVEKLNIARHYVNFPVRFYINIKIFRFCLINILNSLRF